MCVNSNKYEKKCYATKTRLSWRCLIEARQTVSRRPEAVRRPSKHSRLVCSRSFAAPRQLTNRDAVNCLTARLSRSLPRVQSSQRDYTLLTEMQPICLTATRNRSLSRVTSSSEACETAQRYSHSFAARRQSISDNRCLIANRSRSLPRVASSAETSWDNVQDFSNSFAARRYSSNQNIIFPLYSSTTENYIRIFSLEKNPRFPN